MTKLGRGLEALISVAPDQKGEQTSGVVKVSISQLIPNRYQPRRSFDKVKLLELSESLKENGIIQPIIVTKRSEGLYEIIAGERRFQASKLADFKEVPVIVRDVTPKEQLQFAIIENVQREDLNAIEVAKAYQQLNDEFGLTHSQISTIVGKDRATISNFIRLLKLDNHIQKMILIGDLSSGHARAILQVDETLQGKFAEEVVRKRLSVRKTELEAKKIKERGFLSSSKNATSKINEYQVQENHLEAKFQTRVKISDKDNRGKIVFYYTTKEDKNKLLGLLGE